jgi:hypothetical protein
MHLSSEAGNDGNLDAEEARNIKYKNPTHYGQFSRSQTSLHQHSFPSLASTSLNSRSIYPYISISSLVKSLDSMRNIILSVIALASSATAIGNATVKNNSTGTFYVWSVGESPGPKKTVAPGKLLITSMALVSRRGKRSECTLITTMESPESIVLFHISFLSYIRPPSVSLTLLRWHFHRTTPSRCKVRGHCPQNHQDR